MDGAPTWDMLVSLSPWAAAAAVAWSPLGRGLAAWLQGRGGSGNHDRLAAAMERLAEAQEQQTKLLHRMDERLIRIEDRVPRGAGPGAEM